MNILVSSSFKNLWNQVSQLWKSAAVFSEEPELQKSMSDHVLSGHSEGPWGNCGNTTVVQSMGMAEVMANMRQSSKWPVKAMKVEAVLSILWKFPSLPALGWVTGPAMKLQGEQLPLDTFEFTLICAWTFCIERSGYASKAQSLSPDMTPRTRWGWGS